MARIASGAVPSPATPQPTFDLVGVPRPAGTNAAWYLPRAGWIGNAAYGTQVPVTMQKGAGGTVSFLSTAEGWVRRIVQNADGQTVWTTPASSIFDVLPPLLSQIGHPTGPNAVLRFIEAQRWIGAPAGANGLYWSGLMAHQDNLVAAAPSGVGTFNAVGIRRRLAGTFFVSKATSEAVVEHAVCPVDLTVGIHVVEHRLVLPTLTSFGRYECWIDGLRLFVLQGDTTAATFPRPAAANAGWRPLPGFSSNSPDSNGMGHDAWWSRWLVGPPNIETL